MTNTNNQILIGGRANGAQYFEGYIDEVRITKGAARYTSTFAVPTQPFPDQGPTGWDAARMGEGIVLTNNNLTLTKSTNVWRTVLATTGKSSGKWYFEVFVDNQPNYSHIGIARNTATLTDYAGFGADGWMFGANGSKWNGNVPTAFGGGIATGDTIGIAYDLDAGEVSIYRKANGSGICTNLGVMFTNVTGTVYPAVSPYDVTATGHFTSASMSCSVPAGYSTLDP